MIIAFWHNFWSHPKNNISFSFKRKNEYQYGVPINVFALAEVAPSNFVEIPKSANQYVKQYISIKKLPIFATPSSVSKIFAHFKSLIFEK